jgi:hypothetical protein
MVSMDRYWKEQALGIPEGQRLIEELAELGLSSGAKRFVLLSMLKERLPRPELQIVTWPDVPWHDGARLSCMTHVVSCHFCHIISDYGVLRSPEEVIRWIRSQADRAGTCLCSYEDETFRYATSSDRVITWRQTSVQFENRRGTVSVDFGEGSSRELLSRLMDNLGLPEELLTPEG